MQSFFGRLNYTLANKYLFTFTYRADGSSRFRGDNKWGKFPSAAFAWKMKEESFLQDSNTISDLKLRLGWGVTGQQDIGDFNPSLATYLLSTNTAQYQFGNGFIFASCDATTLFCCLDKRDWICASFLAFESALFRLCFAFTNFDSGDDGIIDKSDMAEF